MKYRVTIDEVAQDVDVVVTPDGSVSVSVDGKRQDLDVVRVPGGLSLRIGARVFDLATGGEPDATQVSAGEARAIVEVLSDRMRARRKSSGGALAANDSEIHAPMPGRVIKILVSKGQTVEADEPCVVIEAMKMENELRAPKAGTIAEIVVAEGASVEAQALLIRFE